MKNRSRFPMGFLWLLILLVTPYLSYAGWVEVGKDGSKLYLSKGKWVSVGENEWVMSDINTGLLSMSDGSRKIYTSGTPAEYCDAMSSMQEAMMKDMPPEQRKMMESMMKTNIPSPISKVTVEKQGSGGKIAGYDTVKYKVSMAGRGHREIWVTEDASLMKEMMPFRKKAMAAMQQFSSCMTKMNPMAGAMDWEDSKEYQEIVSNHWVLREVSGGETVTDVVELKQESIPESLFQPPAGYKKIPLEEFFMGVMR